MPNDEYGLGIDIGDATIRAAICRTDEDGAEHAQALLLDNGTASVPGHLMARVGTPAPVLLDGTPHSAADLVAAVVAGIAAQAETATGRPPSWTTVTVPPSWGEHRRSMLAHSLQLAGIAPVGLVSGALAAVHRHVAAALLAPDATVVVIDVGASTLDTAVVGPADDDRRDHLAVPPDPTRWGGRDVDDAVLGHVRRFQDTTRPLVDRGQALREACVAAKEALSTETSVLLEVSLDPSEPPCPVRLTREELEELVADGVDTVAHTAAATVAAAGLSAEDLDGAVLVGGGACMPLVAERLSAELVTPLVLDGDPSLSVVLGAAQLAADAARGDTARTPSAPGTENPAADAASQGSGAVRRPPPGRRPRAAERGRRPLSPGHRARRGAFLVAALAAALLTLPAAFSATLVSDQGQRQQAAAGTPTTPAAPAPTVETVRFPVAVALVPAGGPTGARRTASSSRTQAGTGSSVTTHKAATPTRTSSAPKSKATAAATTGTTPATTSPAAPTTAAPTTTAPTTTDTSAGTTSAGTGGSSSASSGSTSPPADTSPPDSSSQPPGTTSPSGNGGAADQAATTSAAGS